MAGKYDKFLSKYRETDLTLTEADARYLQLTGGTLSGNVGIGMTPDTPFAVNGVLHVGLTDFVAPTGEGLFAYCNASSAVIYAYDYITPGGALPLSLRGQTVNFKTYSLAGAALDVLQMTQNQRIGIGTNSPGSKVEIDTADASVKGLIVKGAAAQTANLQEWQDSTGAVNASISPTGSAYFDDVHIKADNKKLYFGDADDTSLFFNGGELEVSGYPVRIRKTGESLQLGDGTNVDTIVSCSNRGKFGFYATAGASSGYMVFQGGVGKGIKMNVNNATFGSGTALTIEDNGTVGVNITGSSAQHHIYSGATDRVVLKVQGMASQTGDLLQLQDSAAAVKVCVTSGGNMGVGTDLPTHTITSNLSATSTNDLASAILAKRTTSGDMTDGFGVGYLFAIQDSAAVQNYIAGIYAARDGADNSGKMYLRTYSAGVPTTHVQINKSGVVSIGLGESGSATNRLHVEGSTGDNNSDIPIKLVRNSLLTNVPVSSMLGLARTTGDMADGFGIRYLFAIKDTSGAENNIGAFGCIRNGADNTGKLIFQTYNAGVAGTVMTLDNLGDGVITGNLQAGGYKLSDLNTAPASATATGVKGDIRVTADSIYVCIDTDTWVKTALTTF